MWSERALTVPGSLIGVTQRAELLEVFPNPHLDRGSDQKRAAGFDQKLCDRPRPHDMEPPDIALEFSVKK